MTVIVWSICIIGLLFLFEIPQRIYYHFRPEKKPRKGGVNGRDNNSSRGGADNTSSY